MRSAGRLIAPPRRVSSPTCPRSPIYALPTRTSPLPPLQVRCVRGLREEQLRLLCHLLRARLPGEQLRHQDRELRVEADEVRVEGQRAGLVGAGDRFLQ